jgi:preprotein translocase subunit SecG
MKMSVTNTSQRRLSMLLFSLFFLITVAITCLAFARTFQLNQEVPKQEIESLSQKEDVLEVLTKYSKALIQYDNAQKNNETSVNRFAASCDKLSRDVNVLLLGKDTTIAFKNVISILQMADRYLYLIDENGEQATKSEEAFQQQISTLRQTNSLLQQEKTQCTNEKTLLEVQMTGLQSQLDQLQLLLQQKSASGGSGSTGSESNNCLEQIQKVTDIKTEYARYKGDVKLLLGVVKLKTDDIKSCPLSNNNKRKDEILEEVKKFEDKSKQQK